MFWKVRATLASRGDLEIRHALAAGTLPSWLRLIEIMPIGRLVEAGDAVEHGRLAGAVGADEGGDLAAPPRRTGR